MNTGGGGVIIPDICQFWGTATLLKPVEAPPKGALIRGRIAKSGHKLLAFSPLKGAPASKKYTTARSGGTD